MIRWLQITSARGPAECCWVVARILECLVQEARDRGVSVRVLEKIQAEFPGTLKSALLALEGEGVADFLEGWEGTVQWIGNSPFRPRHKRKNWFVGVAALRPQEKAAETKEDLRIETMRSSGPGGQHLNKSETAVRVTHLPTGLSAIGREERSQYLNRKLAMARLAEKRRARSDTQRAEQDAERWTHHNRLERGNPIRVFRGERMIRERPA